MRLEDPGWTTMVGLRWDGCGEAMGVMFIVPRKALAVAIWCMFIAGW